MEWTSLAGSGLNFFEGWENTKSQRKEAELKRKSAEKQIGLLGQESLLVSNAYGQRKGIATDMFGNKMESLASKIGFNISDINRKSDFNASKSGLAFSGTVETSRNIGIDKTQTEGKFAAESLRDQLGRELMELDIWKSSEQNRIASEKEKLRGEISVYKEYEDQEYLGLPDWIHETLGWTPF